MSRRHTLQGKRDTKGKVNNKLRMSRPVSKPYEVKEVTGEIVALAHGQGKNAYGLTAKQDSFARNVADGLTLAASYRAAYDADGMSQSAVHNEASRLMDNPSVAHRVNGLIAEKESKTQHDAGRMRRFVLERLHIEANDPNNPPSVRVRALELIGKVDVVALFRDRIEAVAAEPPASDLAATLESRLRALLPSPKTGES
jgi:hypothetical protein